MATTKKKTAKKTVTASTTGQRPKAKPRPKREAKVLDNLPEIFEDQAAKDGEDAVTRKVNPHLKELQAHLEEALLYVRAARKSTATHESQAMCVRRIGGITDDITDVVGECAKVVA